MRIADEEWAGVLKPQEIIDSAMGQGARLADSFTAGIVCFMSDSSVVVTPIFDQLVEEFRERDDSPPTGPAAQGPAEGDEEVRP
jgi:hypothetical protein